MQEKNRSAKQEALQRRLRRANRLQVSRRGEFLPKGIWLF